ncbi:ATP dependent DNA ligase domain-containing protein [Lactarius akahatsu]|uniref:DNA ligase n=1 Tax=Lactarius akahatsu TaxID=416441 RepID=A0AAD4LRA3_9AGAM|nr:ATP dependent DNA ligase domain-containing protein [Lactarius akahatsu]
MLPTPAPTMPRSSPPLPSSQLPELQYPDDSYPEAPQNRGTTPFSVLSGLFDKLQNERKPDKRRKLMSTWFDRWRREVGHDLYPVLRLLLPQKDRERAIYGLKEKNIAKMYIKLIPLGPKDPDAIRLLEWKKPSGPDRSSGDFPTVFYEVIAKRSSVIEGTLTIDDLNDALNEMSKNISKGDAQSKIMRRIYNRTTPEEQRWIVRIILKDLGISVQETSVFSVFHPDAHDLFNTCSDLKKVAWELWDPERRLDDQDKSVHLFRAFAPMLCKRPTGNIEESVKDMEGHTFILEEKLDGERIQLHRRGNEYFYCSRKGKDYSYLYGNHVGTGSLTPYIDAAFDKRIDSIILDGEMLVWDPVSGRNLPFGTLKSAALDKTKKELNPRPCFKIFDLLYLNGQPLIHKSTKFRKRNLKSCLKEIRGRIEFVVDFEARTAKDVRKKMEDIMAARGEGLVMKHPDAGYVLNGRNKDWIKVKPEYMDNMGETVDALVVAARPQKFYLAGNYGSGKRGGGVSTLICAVLDDRNVADTDEEPKYSTFVRIGTGFSYAEYVWIRSRPWKEWTTKNPPTFLDTATGSRDDKGDVYIEPEEYDIHLFRTGVTLKYTKLLYRQNKGCRNHGLRSISFRLHHAFSSRYVNTGRSFVFRLYHSHRCFRRFYFGMLLTPEFLAILEAVRSVKKRKMEDVTEKTVKKRKAKAKPSVLPEYKGVDLKDVQVESSLLEGLTFMVSSDPKSRTRDADKEQLQKLIRAHGGNSAQVAKNQSGLLVVYGGSSIPYDIKLIMNKGMHDIIRPQWIFDSIANGVLVPMSRKYFFYATAERMESEEYNNSDGDIERCSSGEVAAEMTGSPGVLDSKLSESKEGDSDMQDWLQIGPEANTSENDHDDADSATDPDSDNEDNDNWFNVEPLQPGSGKEVTDMEVDVSDDEYEHVNVGDSRQARMGEESSMEYDQERIFKHLGFYLDTPQNARENGLPTTSKLEDAITKSLARIAKLIEDNGGKIVNLDDEKLTHIVLDKRDDSRRRELMKRTSKPKHRNLVLSDFIEACIEENTLLNEDDFMP